MRYIAKEYEAGWIDFEAVDATMQSYFGMLGHCTTHGLQKWIEKNIIFKRKDGEPFSGGEHMDTITTLLIACLPSAITGFCFWCIEQKIQKQAKIARRRRNRTARRRGKEGKCCANSRSFFWCRA